MLETGRMPAIAFLFRWLSIRSVALAKAGVHSHNEIPACAGMTGGGGGGNDEKIRPPDRKRGPFWLTRHPEIGKVLD